MLTIDKHVDNHLDDIIHGFPIIIIAHVHILVNIFHHRQIIFSLLKQVP